MPKKNKKQNVWVHGGGGTFLGPGMRYPSDDTYHNALTKEVITLQCTPDAHFSMPEKVRRWRDLLKIPGVNKQSLKTRGIETKNGYIKKTYLHGVKFVRGAEYVK